VTNEGVDRDQLSSMAQKLTVVADRGYFKSELILECDNLGVTPLVPKSMTSNSRAAGRFDKQDFIYIAEDDEYRCPAGQRAIRRFTTVEAGLTIDKYWSSACPRYAIKSEMHDWRVSAHHALEARSRSRSDAGSTRPQARRHASATLDSGAPVRHAEDVDGHHTLPDENSAASKR
jgi:hypothetical protein